MINNTYLKTNLVSTIKLVTAFCFIFYLNFNTNAQCSGLTADCDNDGIINSEDLDDDNDGILDILECGGEVEQLRNSDFESPSIAGSSFQFIDENNIPFWNTTATDELIEIWNNGFNGVDAQNGNQFAELNATQNSMLFQYLFTTPGSIVQWSVWHRGRSGVDDMAVRIGPDFGNLPIQATLSTGTAWQNYTGSYVIPAGQDTTLFGFTAINTAGTSNSVGNFIDNITITLIEPPFCDTDGDGIPNFNDLDSDNDGIPDAIENCGNNNLVLENNRLDDNGDAVYLNNAIYDADDGIVANACLESLDSDDDGTPNFLDLDSDDDGCADAIESEIEFVTNLNNFTFENPAAATNNIGLVLNINNAIAYNPLTNNWLIENTENENCITALNNIGIFKNCQCCDYNLPNEDCDGDGIINILDCDPANDLIINKIGTNNCSSNVFNFGN